MDSLEFVATDINAIAAIAVCSACKRLLNVDPIYSYKDEDDNLKEICGRCSHTFKKTKRKISRQYSYEGFAQYFTYPCSNKKYGCREILKWGEVRNHEKVCLSARCPLSFNELIKTNHCNWAGTVNKLNEHIENAHKGLIEDLPFTNNFVKPFSSRIIFTRVDTQLVTIALKYECNDTFYCLVMISGNDIESQCFQYQLELLDENEENSLILQKTRLEPISSLSENIQHPNKMLKIDLYLIKEMLNDTPLILGRFKVVRKSEEKIYRITGINRQPEPIACQSTSTATPDKLIPTDESMLQELECPVCNEYMDPPIYICQRGHSLCCKCEPKVDKCPNCRSALPGIRNFALEKLTTKVNYPCHNRDKGCTFVTTADKIHRHEATCALTEWYCILRCGYKCFRPDMYNHVLEMHPNSVNITNTMYAVNINENTKNEFVLYVNSELFILNISGTIREPFKFNSIHVGMQSGQPLYRFQVKLFNFAELGQIFSFTNTCQCLDDRNPKEVVVPWGIIEPLIYDNNYLNYKVDILKC